MKEIKSAGTMQESRKGKSAKKEAQNKKKTQTFFFFNSN